ncbi:uncharacterized protein C18orf63 isoform X2 [Synchiropus splendidus]|uniref:uncharacterized protein C18orf63 isoform X2 n=1 Tax=Synchiropus splendidus TaxID=270530 RepID=UPI00237E6E78|nr:uncharacterized protein C18orf63 isoform X2 [Synchiropus splendidus]
MRVLLALALPEASQLCCVTASLPDHPEPRTLQLTTCREMVAGFPEILVSPALDSFTEVVAVMTVGLLEGFAGRRGVQLGRARSVSPPLLQSCLSFTLVTRLSPAWNKVGCLLVQAEDFLAERRPLEAVSMEWSFSAGQLGLSVEAHTVRLQPTTLEELVPSPQMLREFWKDPCSVLQPVSHGGALWCHVLPSMKRGQVVSVSRQLPTHGPFQSYRELQHHWSRLYGYRLPELSDSELVYCSVRFLPLGHRLFTYPLSCIRLRPPLLLPAGQQGALLSFLSAVCEGLGARLTPGPTLSLGPTLLSQRPRPHHMATPPVGLQAWCHEDEDGPTSSSGPSTSPSALLPLSSSIPPLHPPPPPLHLPLRPPPPPPAAPSGSRLAPIFRSKRPCPPPAAGRPSFLWAPALTPGSSQPSVVEKPGSSAMRSSRRRRDPYPPPGRRDTPLVPGTVGGAAQGGGAPSQVSGPGALGGSMYVLGHQRLGLRLSWAQRSDRDQVDVERMPGLEPRSRCGVRLGAADQLPGTRPWQCFLTFRCSCVPSFGW